MMRLFSALCDPLPHRDVQAAVAALVLCSVQALVVALASLWIRHDLGGPGALPFFGAVLLAMTVMALWIIGISAHRDGMLDSLLPVGLACFAALILLPALAMVPGGRVLMLLPVGVILAGATLPIRHSLNQMRRGQRAALVATGACLGTGIMIWQNSFTQSMIFGPEMAMTGAQHGDPVFHAALAEMILGYGRISTGLDGLTYTPYHVLSHLWIGLSGRALGVSALEAYMMVPPIIGVPLMIFALHTAVMQIWPPEEAEASDPLLPVMLAIVLLLLLNVFDWGSYVASESYLLALIGFLFGLAALANLARSSGGGAIAPIACALLALLLMASKLSVGLIFVCGASWTLLRQRRLRPIAMMAWGLVVTAACLGFVWLTASSAHTAETRFDPWHFVRAYPDGAWANVIACAGGLSLAVVLWLTGSRRSRITFEMAAILIGAAAAPGLLLRIGGGSAYYFIHVGSLTALVLAAALIARIPLPFRVAGLFGGVILPLVGLAAWGSSSANRSAWNTIQSRSDLLIKRLTTDAGSPPPARDVSFLVQPIRGLRQHDLKTALATSFGAQLKAASRIVPPSHVGRALIFVPPGNARFWTSGTICRNTPMHVPAITGMPMLMGLPPAERACDLNILYGYPEYPGPLAQARDLGDAELCAATQARGFEGVVVLPTMTTPRWFPCR